MGYIFILLGILFIFYAIKLQGAAWLLIWAGISFSAVGIAYFKNRAIIYGKNQNGEMALASKIILFPCILYAWLLWHLLTLIIKEDPFNELIPGVLIGRRLLPGEMPEGVTHILDLTCEFPEPSGVKKGKNYHSFPVLDGFVPDEKELIKLIKEINKWEGTVYIHCAQGHGRTGTVAAALLISRGLASNVKEAVEKIKKHRPYVNLKTSQHRLLEKITGELKNLGMEEEKSSLKE